MSSMTARSTIAILLTVLGIGVGVVLVSRDDRVATEEDFASKPSQVGGQRSADDDRPAVALDLEHATFAETWISIFDSPVLRLSVSITPGHSRAGLKHSEWNPASGLWEETASAFSTTFPIEAWASRASGEIYLAGESESNGTLEIVRVQTRYPRGSRRVIMEDGQDPIGTPIPVTTSLQPTLVGDSYIPASQRAPHQYGMSQIYSGDSLAGVTDLCVDPEGRYVALLTDSQKLYRIPAFPGAIPTLILDGNDAGQPSHAEYIDLYLRPYLHSTGVRVVVVGTMLVDGGVLALWDTDNDGNMDLVTDEELGSDLDLDPTAFSLELSEDYSRAF